MIYIPLCLLSPFCFLSWVCLTHFWVEACMCSSYLLFPFYVFMHISLSLSFYSFCLLMMKETIRNLLGDWRSLILLQLIHLRLDRLISLLHPHVLSINTIVCACVVVHKLKVRIDSFPVWSTMFRAQLQILARIVKPFWFNFTSHLFSCVLFLLSTSIFFHSLCIQFVCGVVSEDI